MCWSWLCGMRGRENKRLQLRSASQNRERYYGLSLIDAVAATIAALALAWARQGAINGLLNAVLKQVRGMLGIG
jgi:hypothetical protein